MSIILKTTREKDFVLFIIVICVSPKLNVNGNIAEEEQWFQITTLIGSSVVLPCPKTGDAEVRWMREVLSQTTDIYANGYLMEQFATQYLISTKSSSWRNLTIIQANYDSAGSYTCQENNGLGRKNQFLLRTINFEIQSSNNQSAVVGQSILLPCSSSENGVSDQVHWYFERDRHQILIECGAKSSERFSIDASGRLAIQNLQLTDEGEYTCIVNTGHGLDGYKCLLFVHVIEMTSESEKSTSYGSTHHSKTEQWKSKIDDIPGESCWGEIVLSVALTFFITGVVTLVIAWRRKCVRRRFKKAKSQQDFDQNLKMEEENDQCIEMNGGTEMIEEKSANDAISCTS